MKDLVSVVIPTYNRPNNLRRSILSVLNQSYKNIEVIIVDDNDPQSEARSLTQEVMNTFKDDLRVNYIKHDMNKNGAAARNTGIYASKGRYVAFLDDDDEWLDNKLNLQIDFLRLNRQYEGCYCLCAKYSRGNIYYTTEYTREGNLVTDLLSLRSEIYTPSLIFNRHSLLTIGGFDESFIRHQDYDLLIRFFEKYDIGCIKEVLVKVHVDDPQNQPTFENFLKNKKRFLNSFANIISCSSEKSSILGAHDVEILYYALKKRSFFNVFLYFFKSITNVNYLISNRKRFIAVVRRSLRVFRF